MSIWWAIASIRSGAVRCTLVKAFPTSAANCACDVEVHIPEASAPEYMLYVITFSSRSDSLAVSRAADDALLTCRSGANEPCEFKNEASFLHEDVIAIIRMEIIKGRKFLLDITKV